MPMKDNILVLCHSNMHRSPFVAEYIRNSAYGDAYEVRDAGLHVDKGQRVPKALQRAFQTVSQGSLKSHKSRQVSINDILWADKIIIMEPENKNDLLQMLGSLHLSDKPRYDQIVSKIISLAQIGGKTAVDDPHHYSPRNDRIRKSSIKPRLPDSRPSGNVGSPAFIEWRGKIQRPETGRRGIRSRPIRSLTPAPPAAYNTAQHALHHDICFRRRIMKASGGG